MPLLTCSECSAAVSTLAQHCPHCGAPVTTSAMPPPDRETTARTSSGPITASHGASPHQCPRFAISESIVTKVFDRLQRHTGEELLVAGKLKTDTEYVIFIIPFWFNVVTAFLLLTDHRLIVATKTLWRGVSTVVDFSYDDLHSVDVTIKKKKLMYVTEDDMFSKIHVRVKDGNMVTFQTTNHEFARQIAALAATHVTVKVVD